tara:strand:- start:2727 stop:3059 length:333 start_codon:yes stop_codon:yes gene_type:complete
MKNNLDDLNILRKIKSNPNSSQRELAKELGFSLGKLNYCLTALKSKGLIKINNFKNSKNKFKYFYILTPEGLIAKTDLTIKYMKLKMQEYDELNNELKSENNISKKENNN